MSKGEMNQAVCKSLSNFKSDGKERTEVQPPVLPVIIDKVGREEQNTLGETWTGKAKSVYQSQIFKSDFRNLIILLYLKQELNVKQH